MQPVCRLGPKPAPAHRPRGIAGHPTWRPRHRPKSAAPAPAQMVTRQRPLAFGHPGQARCTCSPAKRSSARNLNRLIAVTPAEACVLRVYRVSAVSRPRGHFRSTLRAEARLVLRSSPPLRQATQSSPAIAPPAPKRWSGFHKGLATSFGGLDGRPCSGGPKPVTSQNARRTFRRRPGPIGLHDPAPKRRDAGPRGPKRRSLDLGGAASASAWAETHGQPSASPPNLRATPPATPRGPPGAEAPCAPWQPRAVSTTRLRQSVGTSATGRGLGADCRRATRPSGDTPTHRRCTCPGAEAPRRRARRRSPRQSWTSMTPPPAVCKPRPASCCWLRRRTLGRRLGVRPTPRLRAEARRRVVGDAVAPVLRPWQPCAQRSADRSPPRAANATARPSGGPASRQVPSTPPKRRFWGAC